MINPSLYIMIHKDIEEKIQVLKHRDINKACMNGCFFRSIYMGWDEMHIRKCIQRCREKNNIYKQE